MNATKSTAATFAAATLALAAGSAQATDLAYRAPSATPYTWTGGKWITNDSNKTVQPDPPTESDNVFVWANKLKANSSDAGNPLCVAGGEVALTKNFTLGWNGASLPAGTYGWRRAEIRLGGLTAIVPEDGRATLVLGLEGCSGHAEFDLASLRIEREPLPVPIVNQDWFVRYPGDEGIYESNTNSASLRPRVEKTLRGCMLPSRPTTEADIVDLAAWGATLVRFQIVRGFGKIGVGADLDEYFRWLDGRLDNLQDVLGWCAARGMKVCVDLHSPPGGNSGLRQAEHYAMFDDDWHAAAFVDAWRRIARRFQPS